eukprot:TRINITY_DN32478_c0_g1_i1.p1 TRINITY_DN32478_c0_g1~~TRINITY_DN32478_c0_g1_i1.p1  ORF type:complete len:425 (-),score=52.25 TRINITY_DN32478_c0_g1_i1:385-1659(-)
MYSSSVDVDSDDADACNIQTFDNDAWPDSSWHKVPSKELRTNQPQQVPLLLDDASHDMQQCVLSGQPLLTHWFPVQSMYAQRFSAEGSSGASSISLCPDCHNRKRICNRVARSLGRVHCTASQLGKCGTDFCHNYVGHHQEAQDIGSKNRRRNRQRKAFKQSNHTESESGVSAEASSASISPGLREDAEHAMLEMLNPEAEANTNANNQTLAAAVLAKELKRPLTVTPVSSTLDFNAMHGPSNSSAPSSYNEIRIADFDVSGYKAWLNNIMACLPDVLGVERERDQCNFLQKMGQAWQSKVPQDVKLAWQKSERVQSEGCLVEALMSTRPRAQFEYIPWSSDAKVRVVGLAVTWEEGKRRFNKAETHPEFSGPMLPGAELYMSIGQGPKLFAVRGDDVYYHDYAQWFQYLTAQLCCMPDPMFSS